MAHAHKDTQALNSYTIAYKMMASIIYVIYGGKNAPTETDIQNNIIQTEQIIHINGHVHKHTYMHTIIMNEKEKRGHEPDDLSTREVVSLLPYILTYT